MEAINLNKVFSQGFFRIPDYQRGYSWSEKQLNELWDDIDEIREITQKEILELKFEISNVYNALNSNINNKYYLAIFAFTKSLEFISHLYINEYTMKYKSDNTEVGIYDHNHNEVCDYNNEKWYKGTQNRLHNILFKELDIRDKKIHTSLYIYKNPY